MRRNETARGRAVAAESDCAGTIYLIRGGEVLQTREMSRLRSSSSGGCGALIRTTARAAGSGSITPNRLHDTAVNGDY